MSGSALQLKLNIGQTNISNFRKTYETSVRSDNIYNNYKISNMRGVTLIYTHISNNIVINMEKLNNLKRLEDIKKLKDGWNGYGSARISNIVIKRAEQVVKEICIQPVIFPTGRNSIQMQYELPDKSYLEFEIYETKVISMKVPKRVYKDAVFEKFTDIDMERMNKIVKEFYGK